jgi:hypothetical protein
MISRIPRALLLSVLLLLVGHASAGAQTPQPIESGKFRLHKFEQPIGEETYKTVITGGRIYDSASLWTSVGFKP